MKVSDLFVKCLEKEGIINTFMAKGVVDMDADYCLYTIGSSSRENALLTKALGEIQCNI